ncbi:MAG: electron transport complex subunit RsxC [Cellvibrionaceae bacterium]
MEAIQVWDIPGGIHPEENKHQSMELPLAEITIPKELIFPVSQHLGTPATPIVNVDDSVLAGEKIAEAVGPMSVPIHASTSGKIIAIEERTLPHSSGMSGLCIILASDGKHQAAPAEECADYTTLPPKELIQKIRDAGIAGLGGAGFPTAIKLKPSADHAIDTLIINGTECEPYITADDRLMQDFAEDVVAGTELLTFILGKPKRVVIGIEDNKPDAIHAITIAAKDKNIEVATFPTKYPSGGEKQLIQILTGTEVPSGKIPASLGIVVQNVGTAMSAYRAVRFGEPLTWRITTIVGEALETQRNVKALLGTPVEHLLNEHGFNAQQSARLIMGGPMMGFALPEAAVPVVKTTNCIIAPSHTEMPEPPPAQACIRCGMCAEACPASLLPQQLYWYAKSEEYERLQNHNLFDCIECGACSYVCPSAIPLVQYYRAAKGTIRQQEQEKIKSDHARQRFEFRKARIERAEQEKEAKRLARKKAAEEAKRLAAEKKAAAAKQPELNTDDAPEKLDPVAAAMARVKAKEQDPAAQKAKLERAVSSTKSRVEKLQERVNEATEQEQQEKLTAQLKQAEVRLQEAEKNLAELSDSSQLETPAKVESTKTSLKEAPKEALDAAGAAIERAKAKAEAMAKMSPAEKLQSQINSLETRVQKAREKLQKAETEGSDHIDALRMGLEKMENKLETSKKELAGLT